MRELPILFSGPMVRAILDGRKTQTRRVIKGVPSNTQDHDDWKLTACIDGVAYFGNNADNEEMEIRCPYGKPGDRLWVREAFRLRKDQDDVPPRDDWWKSDAWYEADEPDGIRPSGCGGGAGKLRPSIHMPRWASRIDLIVEEVRARRLRDITSTDARAEGMRSQFPITEFTDSWDRNYGKKHPVQSDPWVWAVTFRRQR